MTPLYPLSAIAHQPQLLLALSLLAVCPDIGGVLIRGDRGAAKSTAARGLASLLAGPFVNLPLGATEDRVVGTLDIEAALKGEARLQAGLMVQAHGGLLYIDEVNLLPDHLVDVLLDAAAMGVVRVQRDSLSAEAPAKFALVGSMNPEEGQLRPQFLDRFGLCVDVVAPQDPQQRAEIVRRRMAFEADALAFAAQWQTEERQLQERLRQARARFAGVTLLDDFLTRIAELTTRAGVQSLRADLVLHRAARAQAALQGRAQVLWEDVEQVAPLVLSHRRSQKSPPPSQPQPQQPPPPPTPESESPPDSPPAGEEIFTPAPDAAPLHLHAAPAAGSSQRADRAGRLLRSVPDASASQIHLPSTLRAALGQPLAREHLHAPVYEQRGGRRVLFVVDSSGSMGAAGRMSAAKGAMLGVLDSNRPRDQVALIAFRGTGAALLLDWTNDAQAAEEAIRQAPTGGRTPLAHALQLAAQVLAGQHTAELVLLTDGRANVPLSAGSDAWADALHMAAGLQNVPAVVVDTEAGQVRLGRAAQLAQALGAKVQELQPQSA